MRIAVFSDIHGNAIALDAVLADAASRGVDAYWIVGDIVANGPDPVAVVDRVRSLPNVTIVRGNTDRYVLTGDLSGIVPRLTPAESETAIAALVAATSAHAWTRGCLTALNGAYDWLASLPLEAREVLPDGTRALLVHAAPGRDDGPGVTAQMTDEDLTREGWRDAGADLILTGHTHQPVDRTLAACRIVNVGSVSLPATDDARAMWTQLDAAADSHTIERRFAAYDQQAVRRRVDQVHHPTPEWLKRKLTSH